VAEASVRAPALRRPCVVISQPMYFPWPGFLEQVRLCDAFVHYVDVQYSRGGFGNRVQVKTAGGVRWLTVPLRDWHLGQAIEDVRIDGRRDWRRSQRDLLAQAYAQAPHKADMLALVDGVFADAGESLAELAIASTMALARYFGLDEGKAFLRSPDLDVPGAATDRVLGTCRALGAGTYLTGHGARRYLEHERFAAAGIDVAYVDYGRAPYPQAHGDFTPYVSALDLVAHCGRAGAAYIGGTPVPWRDFLAAHP
jgi:hypothetical protein